MAAVYTSGKSSLASGKKGFLSFLGKESGKGGRVREVIFVEASSVTRAAKERRAKSYIQYGQPTVTKRRDRITQES